MLRDYRSRFIVYLPDGKDGAPPPADPTTPPTTPPPAEPPANNDEATIANLPPWAQEMIRGLRTESAGRRKLLEEKSKAEEDRLKKMGEWQTLAQQKEQENEELRAQAARAELLTKSLKESNDKRVATIPERFRGLVPSDYEPLTLSKWLDANIAVLSTPAAPNLNPGGGNGERNVKALTPEQAETARKLGVSEADYIKYME